MRSSGSIGAEPVLAMDIESGLRRQGQPEDGKKVDITFKSGSSACQFDLKVVYDDDDTATWNDVNLCDLSKIHRHWDKKAGVTRATGE
jgi:hypothetical protein